MRFKAYLHGRLSDPQELRRSWVFRRLWSAADPVEGLQLNSMSTTATAINFKEFLKGQAEYASRIFCLDLAAIPEDKIGACPMGVARSPLHFSAECAGFNLMVAANLRGEEYAIPSEEGKTAYYASIDTTAKAAEAIQTSTAALIAGLDAVSDEDMHKEVPMYWGGTMPLYKFANLAINHMGYHDGQLNYIQSLYGDSEVHWN